jgi:WD40 repeat protein
MCRFHDWEKKDYNYSLLEAHKCEKTPLPNKLLQSIQNHTDEVWYLALSPDGKRLASVGKDKVINIWDLVVGTNSLKITLKK